MKRVLRHRRAVALGTAFLVVTGLPFAWKWTPASEWVSIERAAELFSYVQSSDHLGLWVIGAYVAGAVLFLPINLFIFLTALLFENGPAYGYVGAGVAANTTVGFAAGWFGGASLLRWLGSRRVTDFTARIAKAGFLDIFLFRLIPITPYSTLNVICGSMRVDPLKFYAATFASILPGAVLIVLFERQLSAFVTDMSWTAGLLLAAALFALVGGGFALRWAGRKVRRGAPPDRSMSPS